jgi:hypothetical protein
VTEQGEDRSSARQGGARAGTLRRALWGAGAAVAATAALIAVTLPRGAAAHDDSTTAGAAAAPSGRGGTGNGAVTENAAPQGPQTGIGPLTEAEVDRARSLALRDTPRGFRTAAGTAGTEYLDTDLLEEDGTSPGAPRRVEVLSYDYAHDRLVKQTVNLTTGTVERTDTSAGDQPPPSGDETRRAARLLIEDPLGRGLPTDFTAATRGQTLTSPDQLRLRGMSFSTGEQSAPPGLDKCGTHRCVRLFTQVRNGPWIDTTDYVVDLSDHTVGRIN